ncbi:hypothetical protein Hanom_Chr13g01222171 [Helianthus anomalus]
MPMLWRVFHTIEQIINNDGIDFNLSELSYLYSLVTYGSHSSYSRPNHISLLPSSRPLRMIPHGRINSSLCKGILLHKGIVCPRSGS